jgi:hypothetical protein
MEQIETELTRIGYTQPEATPLLQALRSDALLREAAQVPFYFNTLQLLFAGGKRLSDLNFKGTTLSERQVEITEQFVEHEMSVIAGKDYTPQQAKKYLSFLTLNMNKRNKVVFELTDLQYDWCTLTYWEAFIASSIDFIINMSISIFLGGTVFGLFFGLLFGLVSGFIYGLALILFYGLASGLVGGLAFSFTEQNIYFITTHDNVKWSFSDYFKSVKKRLSSSFVILVFCLIIIFVAILIVCLDTSLIDSLIIVLFLVPLTVFTFGCVDGLRDYIKDNNSRIIQIREPYERFKASMRVLHFSIIQHYHLLYLLDKKGLLPLKLVDFLNYMKDRGFLESDGATWRFRHRLLQDYFDKK